MCVRVCSCVNLYNWSELVGRRSGSRPLVSTPSCSDTLMHIHSHNARPSSAKQWLYISVPAHVPGINGPCTMKKQKNINGEISSLQLDNCCPTYTQRWPTLVVLFPMFLKCEIEPRCSIKHWEQGDDVCVFVEQRFTAQDYSCQT